MAAKKKAGKAKKRAGPKKIAGKAKGAKGKRKNPRGEIDKDEIKDIARDIDQGADNEEGAESKYSEDEKEIARLKRASVMGREEEEEAEDDSGYDYERGIDKEK